MQYFSTNCAHVERSCNFVIETFKDLVVGHSAYKSLPKSYDYLSKFHLRYLYEINNNINNVQATNLKGGLS